MSGDTLSKPESPRRQWVEPTLTRHESLNALTQQNYGPYPPGYFPPGYSVEMYGDTIPGSTGFFVG